MGEVQKHLRDHLFHGLQKTIQDLLWHLYNNLIVMYPQLMTAAHKTESEYEDRPGKESSVRSAQAEGGDEIKT